MYGITGRIVLYTLAGLAAGLFTWLFSDASGLVHLPDSVRRMTAESARDQYYVGMAWGAFVAILLGAVDLLNSGAWGQWPRAIGFGLVVGLVAGVLGLQIGMLFFGALYVEPANSPVDFLRNVLARAIGWAAIGAMAGTSDGWRKGSVRVGRNGFIGGVIGGLVGGSAFEIIPYLLPGLRASTISRLFGFLITGACIGLFISLVQQLFKEAWIRVVLGRNEGRDVLIEKTETVIGRSELADVPLFGDAAIAKNHAILYAQPGGVFFLRDVSNLPGGVSVNDAPLTADCPVRDGDQIRIANRLLVFRERLTRTQPAPVGRVAGGFSPPPAPFGGALPVGANLPLDRASSAGRFAPGEPASGATKSSEALAPAGEAVPSRGARGGEKRLVAVAGPHMGTEFRLTGTGVAQVIGRDPANGVALPGDTKASRAHARVSGSGGAGWIVEDAGSTNGTFVNGQRVTRQELVSGDTILIGTTALRFE